MTLANRLTLMRLALIPVFMGFMIDDSLWTRLLALIIFVSASITDWYDGVIARRTGTVTVIGTFLDPLVDKTLIAAALVGFVELRELRVPAWMVVLIITREFLITGLRSLAAVRGTVLAADKAGKWKTTSQMVAIITILVILILNALSDRQPGLFFFETFPGHLLGSFMTKAPYWLTLIATVTTVVSGVLYIQKYRDLLSREFSMQRSREK